MKNLNLRYWLIALLFVCSCLPSFCQTDSAENEVNYVEVKMNDGERLQGQLIHQDKEFVILRTKNSEIKLDANNIKWIKAGEAYEGKYSFRNPNDTRYFFGASAIPIRKNRGYYQNVNVIFNSVNYGITKNVSIGGGFEIISTILATPAWFLTPKVGFKVGEKWHLGGGVLIAGISDFGSVGLAYGLATYGSSDSNVTAGIGYGIGSDGFSNAPVFTVSAFHRLSNGFGLVTENYIIQDAGINGIQGVRFVGKNNTFDIGLLLIPELLDSVIPTLPFISYVRTF